jgi:hypothetical protein
VNPFSRWENIIGGKVQRKDRIGGIAEVKWIMFLMGSGESVLGWMGGVPLVPVLKKMQGEFGVGMDIGTLKRQIVRMAISRVCRGWK